MKFKYPLLFFFLIGIVIYIDSFFVKFIWDDTALILENPLIKSFDYFFKIFQTPLTPLQSTFYRPLQNLSFMLDFSLYKFNYRGYHLTNIILHVLVSVLLFRVIFLLTQDQSLSLFSSLLFLVSPLWTEVVTYISGRADSLMAIFILLSFLFLLKEKFVFSCFFYLFSLFSKEAALIYPFFIVFYLLFFKKKEKVYIGYLLSLFFISFFYLVLRNSIIKINLSSSFPLYQRILFFITAIPKYIFLIFFPVNQHMSYTVKLPSTFLEREVILSLIFLILLFFLITFKKDRIIAFFFGWYFIFLLPYSGIIPINAFFAEHFVYLSSCGIFVIFVYILQKLKLRLIFCLLVIGYIFIFSLATLRYSSLWRNEVYFYKRIIKLSPNSFCAYNNLGVVYLNQGDVEKASQLFKEALKIYPQFLKAKLNLAYTYFLKNELSQAKRMIKEVLDKDPYHPLACNMLGNIYLKEKRYKEAEYFYKKALKKNILLPSLWVDLFFFYQNIGEVKKAEEIKKKIEKLDKFSLAKIYFFQARNFWEDNDLRKALVKIRRALAINSFNSEYYNLYACILKKLKRYKEALFIYKKALRIDPFNARIYNNLGNLWALKKNFKKAEKNFKRAIVLDKEFLEAYFNLGLLYFENKRLRKAKEMFEKAISLDPQFELARIYLNKIEIH